MRAYGSVQLVGAHYFIGVPAPEDRGHNSLYVVQILLGLQRVVDSVVSSFVEFLVAELGIVAEMGAACRFYQAVRHQGASGNYSVHYAAINQLGYHQTLLGYGH